MLPNDTVSKIVFKCGLAQVRQDHSYGYVDTNNNMVVPFGKYSWCEPCFVGGFARVCDFNNKWGVIDVTGKVVVPIVYDNIYVLKDKYLSRVKAFKGDVSELINLHKFCYNLLFDLKYIHTYTVQEFKDLFDVETINVKKDLENGELFFTYGHHVGKVAIETIPQEPRLSFVKNCFGNIFVLLHEASDTGKVMFDIPNNQQKTIKSQTNLYYEYESDENSWEEDTWDALTDGMYGDFPGSGTDYDLLG